MRKSPVINPEQAANMGMRLQEMGQLLIAVTNLLSQQPMPTSKGEILAEKPKLPKLQGNSQSSQQLQQLLQQLFPQFKLPQAGSELSVQLTADLNDRLNRLQEDLEPLKDQLPQLREEISHFREQMAVVENLIRNQQT
ncbi:hypothetical protein [Phosphitispora fastidiosa]|uniref:hypothetical protein n=1 Tax=Phosphitispora fastidiosa TaxID=2837202 RepID=UPI001E56CB58|nr:hypothetical protein [Phosphitispora fastidiosa]MBU7005261.1 chromosome segregation ATPase [Phosphitispora fastidiosa]